jgi:hypothetical protein
VLAQLVDGPLHGVALFVQFGVEAGRPPAALATAAPVGDLVGRLGDDGLDVAAAQAGAGRLAGVGLVGQQPAGRVRGWPAPRRAIRSRASSGCKARLSWRCPALVTRTSGRQRVSASR